MIVCCDRDDCTHNIDGECDNMTILGNFAIWIGTNQNDEPVCTDYEER